MSWFADDDSNRLTKWFCNLFPYKEYHLCGAAIFIFIYTSRNNKFSIFQFSITDSLWLIATYIDSFSIFLSWLQFALVLLLNKKNIQQFPYIGNPLPIPSTPIFGILKMLLLLCTVDFWWLSPCYQKLNPFNKKNRWKCASADYHLFTFVLKSGVTL